MSKKGKKLHSKSFEQVAVLRDFYQKHGGDWKSQQILELSQELKLTKNQIYKYLWQLKKAD